MALLKQQLVRGVVGQAGNVFDTIINFLTSDPLTPGKDWVIWADYRNLVAPYRYSRVVLKNTGKSDNEEIYIGIQATTHSGGVEAGLILKTYYYFDNTLMNDGTGKYNYATNFFNTTFGSAEGGYATRCFMPFKTDESTEIWANKPPLELWVYSNKARVILVINTEGRYSNGYMGQYIRHVTPQEVPHPLMCFADSFNGGNSSQGEALWYTNLGYTVVDWDGGNYNAHRQNLLYSQHGDFSNVSYSANGRHFACNRIMTPVGWSYDWRIDPTQPLSTGIVTGTHFNYPDGGFEQLLFPVFLYTYTPAFSDMYLLGQMDGVYFAPNNRNVALTEVGSGDCIIFPNLNRTLWYSWMALKDTL